MPVLSSSAPELEGMWQEVKRRQREPKPKTPAQVRAVPLKNPRAGKTPPLKKIWGRGGKGGSVEKLNLGAGGGGVVFNVPLGEDGGRY